MHVGHVEIVAFVAPPFSEDLLELFTRIDVGAKYRIQSTSACCWRRAISINEIESGLRTTGAIQQLAPIAAEIFARVWGRASGR